MDFGQVRSDPDLEFLRADARFEVRAGVRWVDDGCACACVSHGWKGCGVMANVAAMHVALTYGCVFCVRACCHFAGPAGAI